MDIINLRSFVDCVAVLPSAQSDNYCTYFAEQMLIRSDEICKIILDGMNFINMNDLDKNRLCFELFEIWAQSLTIAYDTFISNNMCRINILDDIRTPNQTELLYFDYVANDMEKYIGFKSSIPENDIIHMVDMNKVNNVIRSIVLFFVNIREELYSCVITANCVSVNAIIYNKIVIVFDSHHELSGISIMNFDDYICKYIMGRKCDNLENAKYGDVMPSGDICAKIKIVK